MKVLILSITTGQGHHQCGMAVSDYLNENGVECQLLDCFAYLSKLFGEAIQQGYLLSTQYTPKTYGKLYRLAEKKENPSGELSLPRLTISMLAKKIESYCAEYSPDLIVCTHVFAAQLVTEFETFSVPTIGIITDFKIHPFWEDTALDYYVTANELLKNQAEKKFGKETTILPFGIPISPKFATSISKQEARAQLGIPDKKTVFIISGSMGFGDIVKTIKQLDSLDMDFQILSVCGKNTKAKKKIDNMESTKDIYNYGYVSNVDVMMDAADIIITKPGGLTSSEALAKGLPMILMSPIPGQEDRNAEFFLNNGVAAMISDTFPVDECIYQILNNPWRLPIMEQAVKNIAKPNAAKDLGDFIIETINS